MVTKIKKNDESKSDRLEKNVELSLNHALIETFAVKIRGEDYIYKFLMNYNVLEL